MAEVNVHVVPSNETGRWTRSVLCSAESFCGILHGGDGNPPYLCQTII